MFTPEEIQKQRLDMCGVCEFYKELNRCSKCGCIMPIKVKIKNARCPIGKWESIKEDNL